MPVTKFFVSVDMKRVISKVKEVQALVNAAYRPSGGPRNSEIWTASRAELLPVLSIVHQMIDYSRILQRYITQLIIFIGGDFS